MKNLLLRAEASSEIGTGHVMRCLALSHVWKTNYGSCYLLMSSCIPSLRKHIVASGVDLIYFPFEVGTLEDVSYTIAVANELQAKWLVIDGYQFNSKYQEAISNEDLKVLFCDDYVHCDYYYVDIILNQNFNASESQYLNRESYTQLLLGSDYFLLRKEFCAWKKKCKKITKLVKNILVTFGGADPANLTFRALQALSDISSLTSNDVLLEIKVVVGACNSQVSQLEVFVQSLSISVELLHNVHDMPSLMAWADLAIATGGNTLFELIFMGVPTITIATAFNHALIVEELSKKGVVFNIGWHQSISVDMIQLGISKLISSYFLRLNISKNGQNLIDGNGVNRVIHMMNKISS